MRLVLIAKIAAALSMAIAASPAAIAQTGAETGSAMEDQSMCPVLSSEDWRAAIVAGENNGRELRVTARLTLPTPGYKIAWRLGPADRMMPPAQRLILDLIPSDGPTAQVITEYEATFAAPTPYGALRGLVVVCGERALHRFGALSAAP